MPEWSFGPNACTIVEVCRPYAVISPIDRVRILRVYLIAVYALSSAQTYVTSSDHIPAE